MRKTLYSIIIVLLFSCKKEETNLNSNNNGSIQSTSTTPSNVSVLINSNYKYPFVTIEGPDTTIIKQFNKNPNFPDSSVAIIYDFTISKPGKYRVYSYSVKNSTDSTKYMLNNKKLFNYMKVIWDNNVVYANSDSVGHGAWKICSNEYKFNK